MYDAVMMDRTINRMTERFTAVVNGSDIEVDMTVNINMMKTFSHHVYHKESITVNEQESKVTEKKYVNKYDFCPHRFKTQRTILIHRA